MTHPTPTPVDLAALDLDALRRYRRTLGGEEDRVSYWRRLVHARIDVLTAESQSEVPLTVADLVRVLGDTGSGRGRAALLRIQAAEPLPELPEVAEIWSDEVDPHDEPAVAEALDRLRGAEQQLTAYRRALHERIGAATEQLIEHYRDNPSAALSLIPAE